MKTPYDSVVKAAAEKHGNPPSLLWAQIYHESSFNPNEQSDNKDSSGHVLSVDRGIAQINSVAHPEVTDAEAFNSDWAINWMAQTMITHYKQYGDWTKALIAYNAGHYGPDTAWDTAYSDAVYAAEKLCPFQDNQESGDEVTITPMKVFVQDRPMKAIAVNNDTYVIWTALNVLGIPYKKLNDNGLFQINDKQVQGHVYNDETYFLYEDLYPGIKYEKVWSFTK